MNPSEFQRRKLIRRFETLDADNNGILQLTDYLTVVNRLQELFGWEDADARLEAVQQTYVALWQGLLRGDDDGNGAINAHEFVTSMAHGLIGRKSNFDRVLRPAAEVLFDAGDADGDGAVDVAELRLLLSAYGLPDSVLDVAVAHVVPPGAGIDKPGFVQIVWEYYCGDDPSAPGSWLFGDISPLVAGLAEYQTAG